MKSYCYTVNLYIYINAGFKYLFKGHSEALREPQMANFTAPPALPAAG